MTEVCAARSPHGRCVVICNDWLQLAAGRLMPPGVCEMIAAHSKSDAFTVAETSVSALINAVAIDLSHRRKNMTANKPSRASRAHSTTRPVGRVAQRHPLATVNKAGAHDVKVTVKITPDTLASFQHDQSTTDSKVVLQLSITHDMLQPLTEWASVAALNACPKSLDILLHYPRDPSRSPEDNLARLSFLATKQCVQEIRAEAAAFAAAAEAFIADNSTLIGVADSLVDREDAIVDELTTLLTTGRYKANDIDLHRVFRFEAGEMIARDLPGFYPFYAEGFSILDASRLESAFLLNKKPPQFRFKVSEFLELPAAYWQKVAYTSLCMVFDSVGKYRGAPWTADLAERYHDLKQTADRAAELLRKHSHARREQRIKLLHSSAADVATVTNDKTLLRAQKLGFDVAPYFHAAIQQYLHDQIAAIGDVVATSGTGESDVVLRSRFYSDDEGERMAEREHLTKTSAPHPVTLEVIELLEDLRSSADGKKMFGDQEFTYSVHCTPPHAGQQTEYLQVDGLWPHGFAPTDGILVVEIKLPKEVV